MSISSEIERIQTAKSAIITSIENKGVTVPTGATIDELPELIDSIPSGGGGGGYLPSGYKKILYIETDGTSYSTNVLENPIECNNIQINASFWVPESAYRSGWTDTLFLSLAKSGSGSSSIGVRIGSTAYIPYWYGSTGTDYGLSQVSIEQIFLNFKNTKNTLYTNYGSRGISGVNDRINRLTIFTDNRPIKLRMFDSFILDGDTNKVLMTLLPCIEESTGLYGFFDLIQNKFYTATTGTFSGGL